MSLRSLERVRFASTWQRNGVVFREAEDPHHFFWTISPVCTILQWLGGWEPRPHTKGVGGRQAGPLPNKREIEMVLFSGGPWEGSLGARYGKSVLTGFRKLARAATMAKRHTKR